MKKVVLLSIIALFVASCEKTYSVEEFKKDEKLRNEWGEKCFRSGKADKKSKNCQNVLQADNEMFFSQPSPSTDEPSPSTDEPSPSTDEPSPSTDEPSPSTDEENVLKDN
ncbi:cytoskeletal protein RodZ [Bartonella japonica]|uniref:Cytoskeletal protein RodZ n=1 Tax=Bartonella japonica TaxID=357761 RepID=A0ABV2FQ90_9HYPH